MPSITNQLKHSRDQRKFVYPKKVNTENGKSVQVFKKNSTDFILKFLESLKKGLITTPLHNSALVTATQSTKTRNKRFVQQENNKDMLKSVGAKRESYQVVDIYYKIAHFNSETRRWDHYTKQPTEYKLSIPVLNKLIEYATSRRQSTLLYKFQVGQKEGGEPILDYTPLENFFF